MTQKKVACPILQIFGNMNMIDLDNITENDLDKSLSYLRIEPYYKKPALFLLSILKSKGVVNVDMINEHNGDAGECDASLSRDDYDLGNSVIVNPKKINKFKSFSSNGKYITLKELVLYHIYVESKSISNNLNFYYTPREFFLIKMINIANLYYMFSASKGIPLEYIDDIFINEKFPVQWEKNKESKSLMNYLFVYNKIFTTYIKESIKSGHLIKMIKYIKLRQPRVVHK